MCICSTELDGRVTMACVVGGNAGQQSVSRRVVGCDELKTSGFLQTRKTPPLGFAHLGRDAGVGSRVSGVRAKERRRGLLRGRIWRAQANRFSDPASWIAPRPARGTRGKIC